MTDALVRAHVAAFNDRDLEALMAGFAPDAVWITGQYTVRGDAELRDLFQQAMDGLLPTLVIENLVVDGDRAAAQMTERMTVDGAERLDSIAGFYVFREGLLVSAKIYREGSADV